MDLLHSVFAQYTRTLWMTGYLRIGFEMSGQLTLPLMVNAVSTTKRTAKQGSLVASWFSGVNIRCALVSTSSQLAKVEMMFFRPYTRNGQLHLRSWYMISLVNSHPIVLYGKQDFSKTRDSL